MRRPELSIAIACYNHGRWLSRAIDSCLPLINALACEVLIIDDASTDETPAVCQAALERSGPPIVRVLRHATNQGLVSSCNEALEQATGVKWLRLDADDELIGGPMADAFRRFGSGRYDIGLTDYEVVERDGAMSRRVAPEPFNPFLTNACGVLFDRSTLVRLGGYRMMFWEEYDLMFRLLRAGAVRRYQPVATYRYHRHGANMTSDPSARLAGWRQFVEAWGRESLRAHPEGGRILNALDAEQGALR